MRIEFATPGNLPWLNAYCALIIKNGNTVTVQSRNGKDLTRTYPTVATAGPSTESKASDRRRRVAADPSARPSLQALQHRSLHPQHQIVFHAFDLRALDGQGLRRQPQANRRRERQRYAVKTDCAPQAAYRFAGSELDFICCLQAFFASLLDIPEFSERCLAMQSFIILSLLPLAIACR